MTATSKPSCEQVVLPDCPPPYLRARPLDRRRWSACARRATADPLPPHGAVLRRCSGSPDRGPRMRVGCRVAASPHARSASASSTCPGRRRRRSTDAVRGQRADQRSGALRAQCRDRHEGYPQLAHRRADLRLALCGLPRDARGGRARISGRRSRCRSCSSRRASTGSSRRGDRGGWPANCAPAAQVAIAGARHEILMERDVFASSSGRRSTPSFPGVQAMAWRGTAASRAGQRLPSSASRVSTMSCSRGSPLPRPCRRSPPSRPPSR